MALFDLQNYGFRTERSNRTEKKKRVRPEDVVQEHGNASQHTNGFRTKLECVRDLLPRRSVQFGGKL